MKAAALIALIMSLAQAGSQSPADVQEAATAKLQAAKSLSAVMSVRLPGAKPELWQVEFLKPNLYKVTSAAQQFRSDGKTEYQYWPLTMRYQASPASRITAAPFATGLNIFFSGRDEAGGAASISELDGKKAIKVGLLGGRVALYLNPTDDLPLGYDQQVSQGQALQVRYSNIRLGGNVSAKDFAWSPPSDAKVLGMAGRSKMLQPGSQAPAPMLVATNGNAVDLAKVFPGHKATLIYFWSGAPSADQTFLKDMNTQAADQRLAIIAIDLAPRSSPEPPMPFPVVAGGTAAKAYGVDAPAEFLVGSDGAIAATFSGFDPGGIVKVLRQRGFRI